MLKLIKLYILIMCSLLHVYLNKGDFFFKKRETLNSLFFYCTHYIFFLLNPRLFIKNHIRVRISWFQSQFPYLVMADKLFNLPESPFSNLQNEIRLNWYMPISINILWIYRLVALASYHIMLFLESTGNQITFCDGGYVYYKNQK